jgi:hypothetical protein
VAVVTQSYDVCRLASSLTQHEFVGIEQVVAPHVIFVVSPRGPASGGGVPPSPDAGMAGPPPSAPVAGTSPSTVEPSATLSKRSKSWPHEREPTDAERHAASARARRRTDFDDALPSLTALSIVADRPLTELAFRCCE